MKKLCLILLFLISNQLMAQKPMQDVVYLNNGGIIRGTIIRQVEDKFVKIETRDKNIFVYEMSEVKKITQEPRDYLEIQDFYKKGFNHNISISTLNGVSYSSLNRVALDYVFEYQTKSLFTYGIGLGINHYTTENITLIPIYTNFEKSFKGKKVSPYIGLAFGHSLAIDHYYNFEKRPSFLIAPSAGIRFVFADSYLINLGLIFQMQEFGYSELLDGVNYNFYQYYSAIGLKLGINLKH